MAALILTIMACSDNSSTGVSDPLYYYESGGITTQAMAVINNCKDATCAYNATKSYPSSSVNITQRTGYKADVNAYASYLSIREMPSIWQIVEKTGKSFYSYVGTDGYYYYLYVEER